MTAVLGLSIGLVCLGLLWLYAHGLANVLEALAIRLLSHAQKLRAEHARQERRQAEQLARLLEIPTFSEMVERR
jgi:hypothetical protein